MASAAPATKQQPLRLFYSYAHEDEDLKNKLEAHLRPLERQGFISGWHDRLISPGTSWGDEIDSNLKEADIILLLVSADFVNSDYCCEKELKFALDRHDAGNATVIPVIMRPCDWQHDLIGRLQALPVDGKPVTSWANQDEALANVASGIRTLVRNRAGGNHVGSVSPVLSEQRAVKLQAALPRTVYLDESLYFCMMVGQTGIELREVLLQNTEYRADPEDAKSQACNVFHRSVGGSLDPAQVVLRYRCSDLDPQTDEQRISISNLRSSAVCTFVASPVRTGTIRVVFEALQDQALAGSQLSSSEVVPRDPGGPGGPTILAKIEFVVRAIGRATARAMAVGAS